MNRKNNQLVKIVCSFFIITVVVSTVLVGWKYYKDTKINKETYIAHMEIWEKSQLSVQEIMAGLSEEEIAEAYDRVYCWKFLVEGTEYLDNSILIRINPYEKNVGIIHMDIVGSEFENEIKEYLFKEESIGEIKNLIGIEVNNVYITELLEVSSTENGIDVIVCADSMELCEKLTEALKRVLLEKDDSIICESEYSVLVDRDLIGYYQTIAEATRAYEEQAIEYELYMSDEALLLFEALWKENYMGIRSDIVTQNIEKPILERANIDAKTVGTAIVSGMLCAIAIILCYFMVQSISKEEREQ